jgi:P-type E1-E2 ATPase
MTSLNKKEFVEGFRNSQAGSKKIIVAVGDGLNDMGMLQAASVGIQLKAENVDMVFGDILVENLSIIPLMMRRECRRLHSNLKQSIYIFFA